MAQEFCWPTLPRPPALFERVQVAEVEMKHTSAAQQVRHHNDARTTQNVLSSSEVGLRWLVRVLEISLGWLEGL